MKLAIMQPYFFPYIGYFQLINAVDKFVIYDDVQFIKEGWIHRNRLLVNQSAKLFTLPLKKASHTARIYERSLATQHWKNEQKKILTMIRQSYGKSPYFHDTIALIESCFLYDGSGLVDFLLHSLNACCRQLGISTRLILSSSLDINTELKAQDRVIAICTNLKASHYINAIGGMDLYDCSSFSAAGINLSFIKTEDIIYSQFRNEFIPWLSIIDVMMFNSPDKIKQFLDKYELV
jgi:hypothetical protein